MPRFTVTKLGQDELESAWPLARMAAHALDPGSWSEFCDALVRRRGGIVGVRAEHGGLHGIATYEPVETLGRGRILKVGTIVAFELSKRAPVRQLLGQALDRMAAQLGCVAVAVSVPERGLPAYLARKAQGLADPREQLDEVVFLRPLCEAPVAAAG